MLKSCKKKGQTQDKRTKKKAAATNTAASSLKDIVTYISNSIISTKL